MITLKFIQKGKGTKIARTMLQRTRVGGLSTGFQGLLQSSSNPDSLALMVLKTHQTVEHIREPSRDPRRYAQLTSDKGAKARQEERGPGPQMVLEQLAILQRKKMSLET